MNRNIKKLGVKALAVLLSMLLTIYMLYNGQLRVEAADSAFWTNNGNYTQPALSGTIIDNLRG